MTKKETERRNYIHNRITSAVRDNVLGNPKYDWKREVTPKITDAAVALSQAELDYAEGKVDEAQVKAAYKVYVGLHEVGQASLIGAEL